MTYLIPEEEGKEAAWGAGAADSRQGGAGDLREGREREQIVGTG